MKTASWALWLGTLGLVLQAQAQTESGDVYREAFRKRTVAQASGTARKVRTSDSAGATQTRSERIETRASREVSRFRTTIDAAPLTLGGFGGALEYAVFDQLTIGPSVSYFNTRVNNVRDLTMRHEVFHYSLRGRFFFFGNADQSALYVMGGAQAVQLDTSASFRGTGRVTRSFTDFGPVGGLGGQFVAKQFRGAKFVMGAGAIYGHGYNYEAVARNNNWETTQIMSQSINPEIFFETFIGVLF